MTSTTVCVVALLAIGMVHVAEGFIDRPGCTDENKGSNGLYPKHCYDVLDEFGECLLDEMEWFEEECSRGIDDPGYYVLREYQDAIDACFAAPDCKEVPYTW